MYIKDGIAYAGEAVPPMKVSGIRAMDGHRLWIRFHNGEVKIFTFGALLESPAFLPLKDDAIFKDVYIDYGIPVWNDGDIDISPEYLYENSIAV